MYHYLRMQSDLSAVPDLLQFFLCLTLLVVCVSLLGAAQSPR